MHCSAIRQAETDRKPVCEPDFVKKEEAMRKSYEMDMTRGPLLRSILIFTLPLLLSGVLQLLFNATDIVVVGQFAGANAMASVGSTTSLFNLLINAFIGISVGANVLVARYCGEKNYDGVQQTVQTSLLTGLVGGVILVVLGIVLARPMLTLMKTPDEVIEGAVLYMRVYFIGMPATMIYNFGAAVLRAVGDTRRPLYFLMAAGVMNVLGDLLFVCVLGMGVAGAAIATVVSQLGSGLLCVAYLKKRFPILHMEKDDWKTSRPEAMRLLGMGVPVGLQFSITAIGSVILQSAVNSLGAVCVSGVAVAGKIYTLLACPFDALAMAATNFTGQNLGAGKYDRIKQGTYACMFIGILYCVLFVLIAQFGTRYLALLFMNADEAASVMDYTQQLSVAFAYATPLLLAVNVLRLSIQGMGYSRLSLISGLLEMLARTVVSLWAVPAFGFDAACLASPFAWLLADCFLIPAFYGCLNARRRQAARVRQELPSE